MCLSLQNTSSVGVYDVVQDTSPGEMTMEESLPHKGNQSVLTLGVVVTIV